MTSTISINQQRLMVLLISAHGTSTALSTFSIPHPVLVAAVDMMTFGFHWAALDITEEYMYGRLSYELVGWQVFTIALR